MAFFAADVAARASSSLINTGAVDLGMTSASAFKAGKDSLAGSISDSFRALVSPVAVLTALETFPISGLVFVSLGTVRFPVAFLSTFMTGLSSMLDDLLRSSAVLFTMAQLSASEARSNVFSLSSSAVVDFVTHFTTFETGALLFNGLDSRTV